MGLVRLGGVFARKTDNLKQANRAIGRWPRRYWQAFLRLIRRPPGLSRSILCLSLLAVALVAGSFATRVSTRAAAAPQQTSDEDESLRYFSFRAMQRRSEGGAIHPNSLGIALAQRNAMLAAQGGDSGGVFPGSWTWQGPSNVGGRVRSIIVDPANTKTIWVGSVSGGIWKTTDRGVSWVALDDFLPTLSVGCMALDTSKHILYAGTGEGFEIVDDEYSYAAYTPGAGIFKSEDGGMTWVQLASTAHGGDWLFVNRIAISPANGDLLLAATRTGLYRSTDGGESWNRVSSGEVFDVKFDPADASHAIMGRSNGTAAYSVNGGTTWSASYGLSGHRVELAYAPSGAKVVYAAVSYEGHIKMYRSADGGSHFYRETQDEGIETYDNYNSAIWVDPADSDCIIVGGRFPYRSSDRGATLEQTFDGIHADLHQIISDPSYGSGNNKRIYIACDNGIWTAANSHAEQIDSLVGLGVTQIIGAAFNSHWNQFIAGAQDNGTNTSADGHLDWVQWVLPSDGGYCATDKNDGDYFYGSLPGGRVFRSSDHGATFDGDISPPGFGEWLKFNYFAYMTLDPNSDNRLYVGGESLWRTRTPKGRADWEQVKEPIGGGEDLAQWYFVPNLISTFTIAEGDPDLIYVGYNNGQLWKSTNGLSDEPAWNRVDSDSLLPARCIGRVSIDPGNKRHALVSFMGWDHDNIWETKDGGTTWHSICGSGPYTLPSVPVSAVAINPLNPRWIYAGTDLGIFASSDAGNTWSTSTLGPGAVAINDLAWNSSTQLMVSTYGRGVYTADIDITQEPFSPEEIVDYSGSTKTGNLSSLLLSDDKYLVLTPGSDEFASVTVRGVAPTEQVHSLLLSIESHCNLEGTEIQISAFNFVLKRFVNLGSAPLATMDETIVLTVPPGASEFIQGGTRKTLAKLTFGRRAATDTTLWRGYIDEVHWQATP